MRALAGREYPSFGVRNPLHGTRYEVYAPAFPAEGPWMCECPDYAHRGAGRCKHIDAVHRWLVDHPNPPLAPTTTEVGRQVSEELTGLVRDLSASDRHGLRRSLRWAEPALTPALAPQGDRPPDERSARRRTAASPE